jgi:hypothetical protein
MLPPLIEDLLRPEAYPHPAWDIELLQTHISYVVLAGDYAYKVKKPVDLGFVDYSTLERRRRMCEEEVRLNARLCPEAYLGVVPITLVGERHVVGGAGVPVEHAVKMRRMPRERMMPSMLERGEVTRAHGRELAREIATFHERAADRAEAASFGGVETVRGNWAENIEQVAPYVGRTLSRETFDAIGDYVADADGRHAALIEERKREGRVRECHGDLRTDSVVIHDDGSICVMDCIEFSERLRFSDVAADIAFLAMDLEFRGHEALSDELLASYLGVTADDTLPVLMPFYKCYRAYVRGKVESLQTDEPEVDEEQRVAAGRRATQYFALAERYAAQRFPQALVMMVGLSGSGKSYVAHALAARIGAVALSTDALRKRRAGVPLRESIGAEAYTGAARDEVYVAMMDVAREHLHQHRSVVLDATFILRAHRALARELGAGTGVPVLVSHVLADDEEVRRRLDARARAGGVPSDADWAVYLNQREQFEPLADLAADDVLVLDGGAPVEVSVDRAVARLERR